LPDVSWRPLPNDCLASKSKPGLKNVTRKEEEEEEEEKEEKEERKK